VQQMGLTVKHSPRYRLTPLPGDFHVQANEPPLSDVLQRDAERDGAKDAASGGGERKVQEEAAARVDAGPRTRRGQDDEAQALGGLVERFQREARGVRSVGTLPVLVEFPDSGPGLYLAAALTADGASPSAAFTFKRAVK